MTLPPKGQDLGAHDKPFVGIIMGEHVTLLLWSLIPPDVGCDKWVLTGRGFLLVLGLGRFALESPHRTFGLTNTRVVGVPPQLIPLHLDAFLVLFFAPARFA